MADEPVKKTVYLAGLAWRQLRDDPGRASRLAVRLAARTPLGARLRRSRLVVPKPRDVGRETRDLRLLLAEPAPRARAGPSRARPSCSS
ncbi:hypothetical protein ACFQY7_32825 [Actinomadura luteofluorescens]|uniref:hypothetical protein n=1 Tax=Actinomadura luteofluorescens TaxID=46163 RepID=UPI003644922D